MGGSKRSSADGNRLPLWDFIFGAQCNKAALFDDISTYKWVNYPPRLQHHSFTSSFQSASHRQVSGVKLAASQRLAPLMWCDWLIFSWDGDASIQPCFKFFYFEAYVFLLKNYQMVLCNQPSGVSVLYIKKNSHQSAFGAMQAFSSQSSRKQILAPNQTADYLAKVSNLLIFSTINAAKSISYMCFSTKMKYKEGVKMW